MVEGGREGCQVLFNECGARIVTDARYAPAHPCAQRESSHAAARLAAAQKRSNNAGINMNWSARLVLCEM